MTTIGSSLTWTVVDSKESLKACLLKLEGLPSSPPSLYVDLEGVRLGRLGSVSLLSLHVAPESTTYLIDVCTLGEKAFDTKSPKERSLRDILESDTVSKVFFDVRNDSDALFSHYGIKLAGVKDLQLMELATRRGPKKFVTGLARCIERDSQVTPAEIASWLTIKESATRLYDPTKGGRYEIFNERPLNNDIAKYSAQDVALLPKLWRVYARRLSPPGEAFWRMMVEQGTLRRVEESQSKDYDGQAKTKVLGPWKDYEIEDARETWNEDIMSEAVEAFLE